MGYSTNYLHKLQVWETDFGRDGGWYVEFENERVAELVEPEFVDQFWYAYRVVPIENQRIDRECLQNTEFWDRFDCLSFRSKRFDVLVEAFPAASPLLPDHRVLMRGLYIPLREPNVFDRVVLRWRSYCELRLAGPVRQRG